MQNINSHWVKVSLIFLQFFQIENERIQSDHSGHGQPSDQGRCLIPINMFR